MIFLRFTMNYARFSHLFTKKKKNCTMRHYSFESLVLQKTPWTCFSLTRGSFFFLTTDQSTEGDVGLGRLLAGGGDMEGRRGLPAVERSCRRLQPRWIWPVAPGPARSRSGRPEAERRRHGAAQERLRVVDTRRGKRCAGWEGSEHDGALRRACEGGGGWRRSGGSSSSSSTRPRRSASSGGPSRERERCEQGRRAGCSGFLHRLDDAWARGGEWSQREGATRRVGAEPVGPCCCF
jgi:hypothetical protein